MYYISSIKWNSIEKINKKRARKQTSNAYKLTLQHIIQQVLPHKEESKFKVSMLA